MAETKTNEDLAHTRLIAEVLHKSMCHSNHTEDCFWYYHEWDRIDLTKNTYHARARYYRHAQVSIKALDDVGVPRSEQAGLLAILVKVT